jgi:hypothetical protein
LLEGLIIAATLAISSPAWADHVPVGIDIPVLRPDEGEYLEFINPTEHPGLVGTPCSASPPGVIETEEHTGYTLAPPVPLDIIEVGDGDIVNGDTADFDWVQEHRTDELAGISNHPGLVGAMGWTCDSPEASLHVDPGIPAPHGHSVAEVPPGILPELDNPPCPPGLQFNTVDIFSVISDGEDFDVGGPREMALDYEVAFCNSVTGASSVGTPVTVWVPGWTALTPSDDYVARWTAATPGLYDIVAIEPAAGAGHDEVTEIDAIKVVDPELPNSNHFKVYDVDDIPVNQVVVLLEDQFGAYDRTALWLDLFANPVDKNFEGILDVDEHQKWYSFPPAPVDRVFNVINQFGDEEWQTTDLTHLVVPSEKEGSPGPGSCAAPAASAGLPCVQHSDCDVTPGDGVCDALRHFACYNAVGTHDPIIVQLEDQFGPEPDVQVLNPRYWCNPAQKTVWDCCNGDLDGDGLVSAADLAILLGCVGLPPIGACAAADIDCDGLIAATDVAILQCQFATGLPDQSCCPGNSPEVYPIVDDINHLACYDIEPKVDHAPLTVTTRDQLDESDVAIRTNELLCVPSIKVIPEPGFLLQLGVGLAFLATIGRRRRKT